MGKYPYFPSVISKWIKAQTHKAITTPSSPATGYYKLYFKSDGNLYKLNSSGTESTTGVSPDLSSYATLASPTFTGTVVLPNVPTIITTQLNLKSTLASPTFTGVVAIPNVANLETAIVANTAKVSLTDNSVTLARLAHGTADKVLGFDGSGNPAELTASGGRAIWELIAYG